MKVILYMATTVNGYISRENDSTDFVTETEWNSFRSMVERTGNLIVGRKTYDVMLKENEFENLPNVAVVVVSSQHLSSNRENTHFVTSCSEAIDFLTEKNYEACLVAGGGSLNSSFLKERLIDEIYVDIEPLVLGSGKQLFSPVKMSSELELLDIRKLSKDEVQLHYQVKK